MPAENDYNPYHPLHLITAENLTSLSITWNANHSFTYGIKKWLLPKLSSLSVNIPLLTRDLIDSLVGFVLHCHLDPAVELDIERHNLSEQQIGSVNFPLRGVVKYRGPLPIASFPGRSIIRSANQSDPPTLAHLVMNEPLDLGSVLNGLENLPRSLITLDIQIRKWDIELLFAIRSLFHDIRSLIVRFGKGTFPAVCGFPSPKSFYIWHYRPTRIFLSLSALTFSSIYHICTLSSSCSIPVSLSIANHQPCIKATLSRMFISPLSPTMMNQNQNQQKCRYPLQLWMSQTWETIWWDGIATARVCDLFR